MECLAVPSPIPDEVIKTLHAGDSVLLNGIFFTARDAAHLKIVRAMESREDLPLRLEGQTIYYCGPSPTPPGRAIGSAGPTTSSRLDSYTIAMLKLGVKAFIGKGRRSKEAAETIRSYGAIYLITLGGAGAYLSKKIKRADIVAFGELGPEAILRLEVDSFPAVVACDIVGGNIFDSCHDPYRR